jgi:hypothetical protein
MRKFNSFSIVCALAVAGASCVLPANGQTLGAAVMVKEAPTKPVWLKAEVVHADLNFITVREQANERTLHTFTYAPRAQAQVQKVLNQGGYQYGDKVKIRYESGQTVALAVTGKPSKPAHPMPTPAAPLSPRSVEVR